METCCCPIPRILEEIADAILSNLQNKRKWTKMEVNLTEGDIVLLKNNEVIRDQWPMGVVERVFPCADNRVRIVQIRVAKDRKSFIRPICELIPVMRELVFYLAWDFCMIDNRF